MKNKIFDGFKNLLAICLILGYSATGKAVFPAYAQTGNQEYQTDVAGLQNWGNKQDIAGFKVAADRLLQKWQAKDNTYYLPLLTEICADLTSENFGLNHISEQHALAESYASTALRQSHQMPIRLKSAFVENLNYIPGHGLSGPKGDRWRLLRRDRVNLWLDTWQKLSRDYDPDLTQKHYPPQLPAQKYIMPHAFIINGSIDPNQINDPVVRAQWLDAWKVYYNEKEQIRQNYITGIVLSTFVPVATRFLIAAYSVPPNDVDELRHYLKVYSIDERTSQEIMKQVDANAQHVQDKNPT